MGTNCLGPYLLTVLLEPILVKTASSTPPYGVRVIFVVSLMKLGTPPGGVAFDINGTPRVLPKAMDNYMQSKAGSTMLSAHFAERLQSKGLLTLVSSLL
jgi:retinol dehydrogenase-12